MKWKGPSVRQDIPNGQCEIPNTRGGNIRPRLRISLKAMLFAVAVLAACLSYFVLPSVRAHRLALTFRTGNTELGACEATIDPVDISQIVSATRTVRVKSQFGLGFKRLVYRVTLRGAQLKSEEVSADEWSWGLTAENARYGPTRKGGRVSDDRRSVVKSMRVAVWKRLFLMATSCTT